MLFHLIRKELLDQLLSLRFAIACIVCLLVFLLSSIVLTREYREATSAFHMNQVMHRNAVLQLDQIYDLWQGISVDRPLNVMNILVRGVTPELTESIQVRPENQLDFPESYEQNPVAPLFPEVDFVFIVGIIMSLLALAFSYDAVSGERESGVLKVTMSYSVPRDLLLLGKWIGSYLALIAPFIVAFLIGLVITIIFPEVEASIDHTLAIIALLALALLYLSAVFSLGILVSCRTQIASTSITVLLLLWVVLILAVPNMAPYITSQFVVVPSRASVDREKAEIQQEGYQKLEAMVQEEQKRTGNEEVWNDEGFRGKLEESQKEVEADLQKVEDSYMARMPDQTRWSGIVARLSPLTSFHLAALDLGAAGIEQETRFVEALKKYSKSWGDYTNQKMKVYEQSRQEGSDDESVDLSDYPRFSFQHMDFEERLSQVYMDVLLLALWNLLFFMLAYLSFLRYDVR
jgi:ABC-type transport system involved in multi-copper enzyme maturation permease subunit